jgi:hypothetical protein
MIQKYTSVLISAIGRFGTVEKGLVRLGFQNNELVIQSYLNVKTPINGNVYTIATLPTAASTLRGTRCFVSDGLSAAVGTTPALGSILLPVYCSGAAWFVG